MTASNVPGEAMKLGVSGLAVRGIHRSPAEHVAALSRFGVATLHEAMGRRGLMDHRLRPIYAGAQACGTAVTVFAHPGDNWMLHVAAELLDAGDIVVMGVASECMDGYFGELLATSFRARGGLGLVIDAGCRDVADLTRMRFPVWSRAVNAQGTVKATPGAVNTPVMCGGVLVNPGDVVVADDDGVVVVPRAEAAEVARLAAEREEREAKVRSRLAAGELGLDIYGMREKLAGAGLRYLGHPGESE